MPDEEIQLAACWYKLARAVAIADERSIEVEEDMALRYLIGFLRFQEDALHEAKAVAEELRLESALDHVGRLPIDEREQILTGLLLIARADGTIHDREREFLASVVTRWKITLETLETLSLRAKGISEALKEDRP